MAFQKKYKHLTKHTLELLELGESASVDFKLKPEGIHVDDLVSFANSIQGGEILVGVSEKKRSDGSQFGHVVGCDLSDDKILQILNKAVSAVPPVSVKLVAENVEAKAMIRIIIPSSANKPHSTPKGVYCRRDGSRNRPLHPNELLAIFLDSESRAFAKRFEESAETISNQLANLESSLSTSIDSMASGLGWVDSQLDDTENAMQKAAAYSKLAHEEASSISARLRELFRQDQRQDPIYENTRAEFLQRTIDQFRNDPNLIEAIKSKPESVQLSAKGKTAVELSKDDLYKIFEEAYKEVTGEKFEISKK